MVKTKMRKLESISDHRFGKAKRYERKADVYGQTPKHYKKFHGFHVSCKDSHDSEDYKRPKSCLRPTYPIPPSNLSSRESSRSSEASSVTDISLLFGRNSYTYSGRDDLESNPTVWDRLSAPKKKRPFVTAQRPRRSKEWINKCRKQRPLIPDRKYCNRFSNSFINLRHYRKSSGSDFGEENWKGNSAENQYKYNSPVGEWVGATDQETTDSEMPRSDQAVAGSEATFSENHYMNMDFFKKPRCNTSSKPSRGRSTFEGRLKSPRESSYMITSPNSYKKLSENIPEALNKFLDTGMNAARRFSSKKKIAKPNIQMKFPKLYPGKSYPCDSRCEGLDNSYSAENNIVLKNIEYQQPVQSSYETLGEKEVNDWEEDTGRRSSSIRRRDNVLEHEFHTDYDPYATQKGAKKGTFKPRYDRRIMTPKVDEKPREPNLPRTYNRDSIVYTELNRYPAFSHKDIPKSPKSQEGKRCNITYSANKVPSSEDNASRNSSNHETGLPLYHDSSCDLKKNSGYVGVTESDFKPKGKRLMMSHVKGSGNNQPNENYGVDGLIKPKIKRLVKTVRNDGKKIAKEQENYVWESSHKTLKPKTKRLASHKCTVCPKRTSKTYLAHDPPTSSKFCRTKYPMSSHKVTFDSQISYAGEGNKRPRRKMGGAEVFSTSFKEYDGLVSDQYCPSECIK